MLEFCFPQTTQNSTHVFSSTKFGSQTSTFVSPAGGSLLLQSQSLDAGCCHWSLCWRRRRIPHSWRVWLSYIFAKKTCKRFMLHTSWDLIWVCLKIIWYISKITQREMVDFGRVWFSSQQSRHSGHFVFRAINGRQGRSASWLNFVEAQKKNSWFNLFDLFLRFWDLRKGFQVFWIHKMLLALVWMAE